MPLAPAVSALARQTIQSAFDDLNRTISPSDSHTFPNTTLQHVKDAVLKLEDQLASRQALRNMRRLDPLFKGLENYAQVMNVLCNGTPYLAWVWAPITLILKVASEYTEAFEQIIKAYSRIAESLGRFEILSDAFAKDKGFQETLAVFYADILEFHKHAYKFTQRSGWKLLFFTTWGRFQRRFDNIIDDMKRHETLIDYDANARNIAEARQMREDVRTWREESVEKLRQQEEEETSKRYYSIMSWLNVDESEQLAIFDPLLLEGNKYPGTCDWAINNKKVKSFFQRKSTNPVLWLQGAPGVGKSMLSAQLTNFAKLAKLSTIYHFCNHSYASSTLYENILRTLLLQLLRKDGDLVAQVYKESVMGKQPPSTQALERLFRTLLMSSSKESRQMDYIWIIIDALNECDVQRQTDVVNLVNLITSSGAVSSGTVCKVLISSRPSALLQSRLQRKHIVSFTEEKQSLSTAIQRYTSERLRGMEIKLRQLAVEPSEIEDIERCITRKSDGMFLYARIVLDYLASNIFYSGAEIKASVDELPKKLSDFYHRILLQTLALLDVRSVERVKSVFEWIAFARRPLRKIEILSALVFSAGDPDITNLAPRYILDICGTLIEERADTTLAFIHVSVEEFLRSPASSLRIDERHAIEEQGIATITCLLSGLHTFARSSHEQTKYFRVAKGLHGLHAYSTEYWTEYLLRYAELNSHEKQNSALIYSASRLSQDLDYIGTESITITDALDKRINLFQDYPIIQKHITISIQSRSFPHFERELSKENGLGEMNSRPPDVTDISSMLSSYQETVRFLLEQDECSGVSTEEFDVFKCQFRASAYTCRLSHCPLATMGFESRQAWEDHEISHTRRWACNIPGCQHPPFLSRNALRNHERNVHASQPRQTSIRQAGIRSSLKEVFQTSVRKSAISKRRRKTMSNGSHTTESSKYEERNAKHRKDTLDSIATAQIGQEERINRYTANRIAEAQRDYMEFQMNLGPTVYKTSTS